MNRSVFRQTRPSFGRSLVKLLGHLFGAAVIFAAFFVVSVIVSFAQHQKIDFAAVEKSIDRARHV